MWAVKSLKFYTLIRPFCPTGTTFQLKKVQKSYLSWHWRVTQSLKKSWRLISIWHEEYEEFSPKPLEVWKFHSDGLFFPNVYKVWAKRIQRSYFHDTEQWCKIWINPDLVVSKMAWGIGWTLIRALKSWVFEKLKNCTLMGSFCPKHIMFQQ